MTQQIKHMFPAHADIAEEIEGEYYGPRKDWYVKLQTEFGQLLEMCDEMAEALRLHMQGHAVNFMGDDKAKRSHFKGAIRKGRKALTKYNQMKGESNE